MLIYSSLINIINIINNLIIITNKYLNTSYKYIRINDYSKNYLINLYCIIYFLETNNNCNFIPYFDNICQMYSILEFNLNILNKNNCNESNENNESDESNENYNDQNNYNIFYDEYNIEYENLKKLLKIMVGQTHIFLIDF